MSSSSQDQPPEDRRVPGVDRKSGGLFRRFRKPAPPPGEAGADAGRQAEAPAVAARPKRLTRLRSRLARTRKGLIGGLGNLFLGKKVIDDEVLEELETRLLLADVGVEATGAIISNLHPQIFVSYSTYYDSLTDALKLKEVGNGLVKSFAFGGIIALVCCYIGFKTTGGARGIGQSTTRSVVYSFMLILAADYFLTRLLM